MISESSRGTKSELIDERTTSICVDAGAAAGLISPAWQLPTTPTVARFARMPLQADAAKAWVPPAEDTKDYHIAQGSSI